jgi:hypothetical protein
LFIGYSFKKFCLFGTDLKVSVQALILYDELMGKSALIFVFPQTTERFTTKHAMNVCWMILYTTVLFMETIWNPTETFRSVPNKQDFLKEYPMNNYDKFNFNWPSGFRAEDWNESNLQTITGAKL